MWSDDDAVTDPSSSLRTHPVKPSFAASVCIHAEPTPCTLPLIRAVMASSRSRTSTSVRVFALENQDEWKAISNTDVKRISAGYGREQAGRR